MWVKDFWHTNLRDDILEQAFQPYLAEQYFERNDGLPAHDHGSQPVCFSPCARKCENWTPASRRRVMRTTDEQISNSLSTERLIASACPRLRFLSHLLATIGSME